MDKLVKREVVVEICDHEWRQIDTETYRCLKCGEKKRCILGLFTVYSRSPNLTNLGSKGDK